MKSKILNKLSAVGVAFMVGVLALVLYWNFYPYNPATFTTPVNVLTSQVRPGESVVYEVSYCKYMDLTSVCKKYLKNDLIYTFTSQVTNAKMGCHNVTATLMVPEYVVPGIYSIEINLTYQVNPIRTITRTFETKNFEVFPLSVPLISATSTY